MLNLLKQKGLNCKCNGYKQNKVVPKYTKLSNLAKKEETCRNCNHNLSEF
jgi:hypothetical protein